MLWLNADALEKPLQNSAASALHRGNYCLSVGTELSNMGTLTEARLVLRDQPFRPTRASVPCGCLPYTRSSIPAPGPFLQSQVKWTVSDPRPLTFNKGPKSKVTEF